MASADRCRYSLQFVLLLFGLTTALIAAEENVNILIREESQVSGPSVELGEIADIQAPTELLGRLQGLTIANAPAPGLSRTIYSYHIRTCLQRSKLVAPSQIAFVGKPQVTVTAIAEAALPESPATQEPRPTQEAETVIARRALPMNHLIKQEDIALADGQPERCSLIGKRLIRAVPAGSEIASKDVINALLVRYGEEVSLLVCRGALKVSTQARALQAGVYGQTIRVRNLKSGKEQLGMVTDSRQVMLNPT